jgi:hypothetical protein
VAKLNSTGGVTWASRFGGTLDDVGHSVAVDSSGNAYVTGEFLVQHDHGHLYAQHRRVF